MYGYLRADTILNNCDNWLYLGGQNARVVQRISHMSNWPLNMMLTMPLDLAYLITRGKWATKVQKVNIKERQYY